MIPPVFDNGSLRVRNAPARTPFPVRGLALDVVNTHHQIDSKPVGVVDRDEVAELYDALGEWLDLNGGRR